MFTHNSECHHRTGSTVEPDDVGCCFPLLGQQLRVVHHLLQEGNNLRLQLVICLKVLDKDTQPTYSVVKTELNFHLVTPLTNVCQHHTYQYLD